MVVSYFDGFKILRHVSEIFEQNSIWLEIDELPIAAAGKANLPFVFLSRALNNFRSATRQKRARRLF